MNKILERRIDYAAALAKLPYVDSVRTLTAIEQQLANTIDVWGEVDPVFCQQEVDRLTRAYDLIIDQIRNNP